MDDLYETRKRRLLNQDLCVRSGVYRSIDSALTMRLNEDGEYEYVGLNDAYEGAVDELVRVAAFGGEGISEDEFAAMAYPTSSGARSHPVLGHYRGLYAGWVEEGDFRQNGSSGGLATWLLAELLRTGQIDGVIHLVPTPGEDALFAYRISRSVGEIEAGSKSRYYPGHLADVLHEIAASKERFALTAIPSFAYEVRLLQQARPEFRERIPYVIGLICGHQKSANYANYIAWKSGVVPSSLDYIDFRKKRPGRPSSQYTTELHATVDGEQVIRVVDQEDIPGTDWGLGFFKSRFSDYTEDAFNETADAVFGDAWLPRYTSDSRGTNVVITRHQELHDLLQAAAAAGRIHLEDLSEQDTLKSQASLVRQSVEEVAARLDHIAKKGGARLELRRSPNSRTSITRRLIQVARVNVSVGSRSAWREAVAAGDFGVFEEQIEPLVEEYRRAQRLHRLSTLPRRALGKLRRTFLPGAQR